MIKCPLIVIQTDTSLVWQAKQLQTRDASHSQNHASLKMIVCMKTKYDRVFFWRIIFVFALNCNRWIRILLPILFMDHCYCDIMTSDKLRTHPGIHMNVDWKKKGQKAGSHSMMSALCFSSRSWVIPKLLPLAWMESEPYTVIDVMCVLWGLLMHPVPQCRVAGCLGFRQTPFMARKTSVTNWFKKNRKTVMGRSGSLNTCLRASSCDKMHLITAI